MEVTLPRLRRVKATVSYLPNDPCVGQEGIEPPALPCHGSGFPLPHRPVVGRVTFNPLLLVLVSTQYNDTGSFTGTQVAATGFAPVPFVLQTNVPLRTPHCLAGMGVPATSESAISHPSPVGTIGVVPVRLEGVEPPRLTAQVPKTCVSANSTIDAYYSIF